MYVHQMFSPCVTLLESFVHVVAGRKGQDPVQSIVSSKSNPLYTLLKLKIICQWKGINHEW